MPFDVYTPLDDLTQLPELPFSNDERRHWTIFLAGGITGCPDWQSEFLDQLKDLHQNYYPDHIIRVFNPRLKEFVDTSDAALKAQVAWEGYGLTQADHVVFWFPKESVCPITLFELGKMLQISSSIVTLGVHPEYKYRNNLRYQLEEQTRMKRPSPNMHSQFQQMLDEIENFW